ncbi:transcription elongation factor, partial [Aureobasidium pullulans]
HLRQQLDDPSLGASGSTAAGRSITRSKRLRSGIMASMEAKDIEERGKQLAKAAVGGDPPATLLALLDGLKGWTATEKLLRQTKIGVHVNKLRQNPDTQVARTATTLVNKWKGDVKKAPATAASSGTNSPAPNKSSPAPAAASKLKAEPQGDLEKRNSLSDKIDTAVTGNQTRDACIKLMYDGLAFMSPDAAPEILKVARSVELAAYNAYQPEGSPEYRQRIRSLYQNLKNKSNPKLRSQVLSGFIKPDRFVRMTHEELKSDKQRAEDEKLQKENMDKAMVAQAERSISASLTCGKCGQKKVSYSQAQTRSADEPMTTFCECTVCGNRWKFS